MLLSQNPNTTIITYVKANFKPRQNNNTQFTQELKNSLQNVETGIDSWIEKDKKKSAKTTAPNHQSGSSIANSNNVIFGQTLTVIITNIQPAFKSKSMNNNTQFAQELKNSLQNVETDFGDTVVTQRAVNSDAHYQSAMKRSQFSSFDDFYNNVLVNKDTKDKKQYNYLTNENINIRISHDTINHEQKKHKLSSNEWKELLENIDNVAVGDVSKKKSRYDGTPVLLKVKTKNNTYGIVLETFKKNNPLISTAFIDTEKNIDNWIKNEGVSSGTKTSFLNITLNNIITDTQPDFKSKSIKNNNTRYQRALTAGAETVREKAQAIKEYYQRTGIGNQNVVDLTDDFDKAPTLDEVKQYINEIVENGTKFATLSPEWFVDIKKESSNKKQKRINGKISNKGNFLKLDKPATKRHNKYVMALEKLLANAEYAGEKENTKQDKKPDIEKYHYFRTNVKIGEKTYQIVFDTEEYKNETSSAGNYDKTRSLKPPLEDTTSITDNAENINPKTVHLYNITEYKNPQSQSGRQNKLFIDNERAEEIANRMQKIQGAFIPAENLIKLFKDADESTIVHEFAHWWLTYNSRNLI